MNDEFRPPHWSQFLGIDFRKLLIFLLVGGLLAAGGWLGWKYYKKATRLRLLAQAESFLREEDYRSAALSARQVLKDAPADVTATKVMAKAAEATGSPLAVFWHARAADLEPDRLENHLDWAASALRQSNLASADQALARAEKLGADSARFHELMGALAMAARQIEVAETHFARAAALEPTNETYKLNLASIRLRGAPAGDTTPAKEALLSLTNHPTLGVSALRVLASDAKRWTNYSEALAWSSALLRHTNSTFADHVEHLTLLHLAKDQRLAEALHALQLEAARRGNIVAELVAWMGKYGYGDAALKWLATLPEAQRTTQPVPLVAAECLVGLKRWPQLRSSLADQNWQELECLRFAFLSRAARETGSFSGYTDFWRRAVEATGRNVQLQMLLARLAAGWGWQAEAEGLWWTIASAGREGRRAALAALHRLYMERRDEQMLLRVVTTIHFSNPNDLVARNNYAQLCLLLGRDTDKARQIASENFKRLPDSSVFRSTYAFSLFQQGRTDEAVKVFSEIPPDKLKHPSLAAYYGVFLAANGRPDEARRHLDLAGDPNQFLPSERRLIAEARKKLQ